MVLFGRSTRERQGKEFVFPVAGGETITLGTMVALNAAGEAVPASDTAGLTVVGVAWGVDGTDTQRVTARRGCFNFDADITDTPTLADVGKPVYAVDDITVANAVGGSRPQAGILLGVDDDGCWVQF